ncbi:MAG TPA: alpha-amylase family glycosyl hydrolase [Thermoanaerobaculia bacterium]|nr:alpha-amylase family glycosyl hydrolase [Thermoanaerobaculia bacterium]
MAASDRAGMGAVVFDDGVSFRVWAPHARNVAVAGDFNGWSQTADPLTHEGNGYWSAFAGFARVGHRYKFVLDGSLWKNDPYAREIRDSENNSVIAEGWFEWQTTDFAIASWNELLIYELHIGTFNAESFLPGTFTSAIDKLDHVRDLGFNAVEIMAAGEFPYDRSWGYNPAYIFAIESSFGGPNAFRAFVDAAHARGIAVIMDVVYNHFANDKLDLWQFDGWFVDPNRGGIYCYNDWRCRTPWGDNRPDYGRGEVRQYFRDNALRWVTSRGCDGLRWDATNYIRDVDGRNDDPGTKLEDGWTLLRWINDEISWARPSKISIAEDMQGNEAITSPSGANFDAQWDAGFLHSIRDELKKSDDAARDMQRIRHALERTFNGDRFRRVIYTESHDEVASKNVKRRVPEDIWPGNSWSWPARKRSTLGAALVFTAPGIPMIFQGQEFLATEQFHDDRPLRWSQADGKIVQLYRDLARLRRNWFDNTRGLRGQGLHVLPPHEQTKVIAFHRWQHGGEGDDVLVVLNFSAVAYPSYRIGFPRGGWWHVRFNSDARVYSDVFGDHPAFSVFANAPGQDECEYAAEISIGAYTALIFSQ